MTGLLFVAVSIRVDVISGSGELRSRASQTLALFITITILAILFVIPGQSNAVFAVELILLALVAGTVMFVLDRRADRTSTGDLLARALSLVSPNLITMLLIAASGVLFLLGLDWALYFDVVAAVAALIGGVVSAWLFTMKAGTTTGIQPSIGD